MQLGQIVNSQSSLDRISGVHPHNTFSPMARVQSQSYLPCIDLSKEIDNTVTLVFKRALLKHQIMSITESTNDEANESMKCSLRHSALQCKTSNSDDISKIYENAEFLENNESSNSSVNIHDDQEALNSVYELTGLFNDTNKNCRNIPENFYEVMKYCDSELTEKIGEEETLKFDLLPPELLD